MERALWNLLGKKPDISNKSVQTIVEKELDVTIRPFIDKELEFLLKKLKN